MVRVNIYNVEELRDAMMSTTMDLPKVKITRKNLAHFEEKSQKNLKNLKKSQKSLGEISEISKKVEQDSVTDELCYLSRCVVWF